MKIKTAELQGAALDWAVWIIEHGNAKLDDELIAALAPFSPSTDWAQGGPIIERNRMYIRPYYNDPPGQWCAECGAEFTFGPTPLVAAMRCYVASKLGDEVDVPEELLK